MGARSASLRRACREGEFTDAINEGLHPGPNPFGNLRLEQPRGRKDLTALTEHELQALADHALACHDDFGPTFRAMILFAGYVGLRPGELCALERQDVAADEVVIRRNLDGTGALRLPKNNKARVVVLPPPARELCATSRRASTCPGCSLPSAASASRTRFTTTGDRCERPSPVMSTYGHPAEDAARDRLKRAYGANVRSLKKARSASQTERLAPTERAR